MTILSNKKKPQLAWQAWVIYPCLNLKLTVLIWREKQGQWRICRKGPPKPPNHGPKFSQFHAVFRKIWQNRMLAPPPRRVGVPILQGILDPPLKVMNTFCIQTCVEKEAVLHIENHQVINLTNKYGPSGCELVPVGDENILECSGSRSFRSARERWWYIAVSHCDNAKVNGDSEKLFRFFWFACGLHCSCVLQCFAK